MLSPANQPALGMDFSVNLLMMPPLWKLCVWAFKIDVTVRENDSLLIVVKCVTVGLSLRLRLVVYGQSGRKRERICIVISGTILS